ncbi:hypothetical protein QIS74_06338 [Colletotrichum tabaci]|uniref:Uncharacterized protein n=1 Tax=Colletotrichum tabaci TaxID=1209068 RepID=A0AAV9TCN6_9PEZI
MNPSNLFKFLLVAASLGLGSSVPVEPATRAPGADVAKRMVCFSGWRHNGTCEWAHDEAGGRSSRVDELAIAPFSFQKRKTRMDFRVGFNNLKVEKEGGHYL